MIFGLQIAIFYVPFQYKIVTYLLSLAMHKENERLDGMADRQRNGVKTFVNYVCCYGRQPVKTNSFHQIMEMQALL